MTNLAIKTGTIQQHVEWLLNHIEDFKDFSANSVKEVLNHLIETKFDQSQQLC